MLGREGAWSPPPDDGGGPGSRKGITMRLTSMLALLAVAADPPPASRYLTEHGQLTHELKAVQLQGGFAGSTGVRYTIAPDGSWASESLFNEKATPEHRGKLTAEGLAKLAGVLEKYGLADLPATAGMPAVVNPRTITFEFGSVKASWAGLGPPKLDPKDPAGTVDSRFAGIWQGVVGLLRPGRKE